MTYERIDIVITDKVSPEIPKKLKDISTSAKSADSAIRRLEESISGINTSAISRLTNEYSRLNRTQVRNLSADTKIEAAKSRVVVANNRAALSVQRLATEHARTEAATIKATIAASRARTALLAEESASLRLSKAKGIETAALNSSAAAADTAAIASRRLSAATSSVRQNAARTQNLIYQVQDIVVGLQAGQQPLTVLLQQGTQIAGAFGPGTGLTGIVKGLTRAIVVMVKPFAPLLAALAVVAGGFAILTNEINSTTDISVGFFDVVKSSFILISESISEFLAPAISTIAPYFKSAYDGVITATKFVINAITSPFVAFNRYIKRIWGDNFPRIIEFGWKTAYNALLTGTESILKRVIKSATYIINDISRVFVGGYTAVVRVWGLLPQAFSRLGSLAINGLLSVVETGVRGVISAIDGVLTFVGRAAELVGKDNPFANLLDPSNINLDNYKSKIAPIGPSISQTITDSFKESFSRDFTQELVDSINFNPYKKQISDRGKLVADLLKRDVVNAYTTDHAGSAFDAIRERSIELALKRAETEKKDNNELSTKDKLLKDIIKPLTEYYDSTSALNELLSEGLITIGQYNESLSSLSLVKGAIDLDLSLKGTSFERKAQLDQVRIQEQKHINAVNKLLIARVYNEEQAAQRIVVINKQASDQIKTILESSPNVLSNSVQQLRDRYKTLVNENQININKLKLQQQEQISLINKSLKAGVITPLAASNLVSTVNAELSKSIALINKPIEDKKRLLNSINKPIIDYTNNVKILNQLLSDGEITLRQYNKQLSSLSLVKNYKDLKDGLKPSFNLQIDNIKAERRERINELKSYLAAKIINEEQYAKDVLEINIKASRDLAAVESARRSMILSGASETFSSLSQIAKGFAGEQSDIYKVLFATSKAFAIADSIIKIQQGVASALALPFPQNIPAIASVAAQGASIVSNIQSVAGIGFKQGGYTGNSGVNEVAGVVHGKEFVFDAASTERIGKGNLERLQRGYTQNTSLNNKVDLKLNVNIENYGTDKNFEVKQITENDVRVIATDVSRSMVHKQAPEVISQQIYNPNSSVSRAINTSTNAQRKQG